MKTKHNDKRLELIEKVQKIGRFWQSSAESSALDLARLPGNKSLQMRAEIDVNRHDAVFRASNEIIFFINTYWPRESNDKPVTTSLVNGSGCQP